MDANGSYPPLRKYYDDVIKWKHFPRYWPFVRGIHRWPVNSSHKGQWRRALMFSLICALNEQLSKQSWGWWLEMSLRLLWRHCNGEWSRCQFRRRCWHLGLSPTAAGATIDDKEGIMISFGFQRTFTDAIFSCWSLNIGKCHVPILLFHIDVFYAILCYIGPLFNETYLNRHIKICIVTLTHWSSTPQYVR